MENKKGTQWTKEHWFAIDFLKWFKGLSPVDQISVHGREGGLGPSNLTNEELLVKYMNHLELKHGALRASRQAMIEEYEKRNPRPE